MRLLDERARNRAEELFLLDPANRKRWTFQAARERVARTAGALRERGFGPGDRLGVVLPPGPRFVWVYLASVYRGLTLVPLSPGATDEELERSLENLAIGRVVVEDEATHDLPGGVRPLRAGNLDGPPPAKNPEPATGKHRLLIHTSGTTGEPKPVVLRWSNMIASARSSRDRLGWEPNDLWLSPLGVHHVGGIAPVVRSLLNGTAVSPVAYDPGELRTLLERRPVTGVSLVPTMLRRILEDPPLPVPESLRFVLLGGAPAPPDLRRAAQGAGYPIHPTYGMTETASQVATATPQQTRDHPRTVGRPLEDVRLRIQTPDGNSCGPGTEGEIVVGGPMVSEGYFHRPEATKRAFRGGWFHTGDAGYRDGTGLLYVTGRIDRRILTGGETVDPGAVEEVLDAHPAVEESYVFGRDDEDWGEIVCAAVRITPDRAVDPAGLSDLLEARLSSHKRPRQVRAYDAFPRTPSGTVDETALRDRWPTRPSLLPESP